MFDDLRSDEFTRNEAEFLLGVPQVCEIVVKVSDLLKDSEFGRCVETGVSDQAANMSPVLLLNM